ncbi:MAG: ribonuclease H-like domain-containing protein [Clostridia bacterium]|nr:ribonuclease H-like domain-containing protein [Clostridia bacterium]
MEKIDQLLNNLTGGKYDFVYKSAVLDSKTGVCTIEIFYKDGTILTQADKEKCNKALAETLGNYKYDIHYTKNFLSEGTIKTFVRAYAKSNYVSVKLQVNSVELGKSNLVSLTIAEEQEQYVKSQKILQDISKALSERFMARFNVVANYQPNMIDFSVIEKQEEPTIISEKVISVTDKKVLMGEEIEGDATYIRDSRNSGVTVTICGKIQDTKMLWTKPKVKPGQNAKDVIDYFKRDVPTSERLEAGQKPYYKFKIQDFTGEIDVFAYPKQEEQEAFASIFETRSAIVRGEVKDDNYFGIHIRATSVSECKLPDVWEEKIDYKKEKPYYEFVKPENMEYTNQVGLFSMFDAPKVAPYLANNEIVVFDFETTGLKPYEGDKIVEIGAVKVINGAIVQSFRTLVNPEMHIPEASSAVHKIYDKDVVNAPKAAEALQDFYKFTRGAVLVGYNVNFDYSFLMTQGKQAQYNFDNKTYDCLDLARRSVKGLKNYKLGTIAKELGVSLENAHSALADTIATAEVFIKLADNIK